MFSKLDKTYFGDRVVKGFEEKDGMVTVTFADDQLPATELMSSSEWEAGKTEKPVLEPDKRQEWFVNRTLKVRQEVLDLIVKKYNPRFSDLQKIIMWINEGITQTYKGVVAKVFGVNSFELDVTVKMIVDKLKETEKDEVIYDKWTPIQKQIFQILLDNDVKVHEVAVKRLFEDLQGKTENLIDRSVSFALGSSDTARRCNDFEEILKKV